MEFFESLLKNHLFLMSLTVALGILVGKISVRGINLGISGALFVGLFIGAQGYSVPNEYFAWNLMFFVVAVGLLAAEDTARVVKRHGSFILLSVAVTGRGASPRSPPEFSSPLGVAEHDRGDVHRRAHQFAGARYSTPGKPDVTTGYWSRTLRVMAVVLRTAYPRPSVRRGEGA